MILEKLRDQFCLQPDERSIAMDLFRDAFDWDIKDISIIGAWHYFDGSAWSNDMIDQNLASLLEAWVSGNGGSAVGQTDCHSLPPEHPL